ncbi:MAG: DUF2027 domain-containing protein [Prevotellaceae bacterium]|jgi:hypothetical protein|nr:DUF2027 domain-containing protein [Prevotellaceae bacterium]
MKYKIGDRVKFLNDTGGGRISGFAGSNVVKVMDEDGFEIPVLASELIPDEQQDKQGERRRYANDEYSNENTRPTLAKPERMKPAEKPLPRTSVSEPERDGDDYELLFAFVRKTSNVEDSDFHFYFVNDSPFCCMYAVSRLTGTGRLKLTGKSDIEPETKELVAEISRRDINAGLTLNFTCLLYKTGEYKPYPPEQVNVELNPLKFAKSSSFTENDYFDEDAYIIKVASDRVSSHVPDRPNMQIDPKALETAIKQKKDRKPAAVQKPAQRMMEEIDLHIEHLLPEGGSEGLDKGQMLEIQLARFTTALELGIGAKTERMVFIHGVGNGKLKREILRMLDTRYADRVRYQDASFEEYGYGATMVIID